MYFELLLKEKVTSGKECNGQTPLTYVVKYRNLEIAKLLIQESWLAKRRYYFSNKQYKHQKWS